MVDFQERDASRSRSRDADDATEDPNADAGGTDADVGGADADAGGKDADADGTDLAADEADPDPAADAQIDGESSDEHHAHDLETATVAVLTVSSSRTIEEDAAGDAVVAGLEDAGHEIATRNLVRDDYDTVQGEVDTLVGRDDVDAVVTTGGTGVAPTDVTVEAVRPLFEKVLPGFGELFRALSREEIGTRVLATRALAGIADGVPVFCLPGSEAAARLGANDVVAPEIGHVAGLSSQDEDGGGHLPHVEEQ